MEILQHPNPEDNQLWIGWKWFEYHSKQRMDMMKFFLTLYLPTAAVALSLLRPETAWLAMFLSAASFTLALVFWQMDVRSRQLIAIGEKILDGRWKALGFGDETNPISLAAVVHASGIRYKYVFFILFIVCALLSMFLFGLSVYAIEKEIKILIK